MQNLVEDKFDLRSHGSNDFFLWGITLFFLGRAEGNQSSQEITLS